MGVRRMARCDKSYDIVEHRHRLAVKVASSSVSRAIGGLRAQVAAVWVSGLGLKALAKDFSLLPQAEQFDDQHREWRAQLAKIAGEQGRVLHHGGAAKIINIYLKLTVVCAVPMCDDDLRRRVGAIHPPIDRILNKGFANKLGDKIRLLPNQRAWSGLNSDEYEAAIERLRCLPEVWAPDRTLELWRAEEFWAPFDEPSSSASHW